MCLENEFKQNSHQVGNLCAKSEGEWYKLAPFAHSSLTGKVLK